MILPILDDPYRRRLRNRSLKPGHTTMLVLDILEIVFEYLYADSQSLRACSQTCWAFCLLARRHLFRSVSLLPSDQYKFLDVLASPSNPGRHVKVLTIFEVHFPLSHSSQSSLFKMQGKGNLPFERPFFWRSLPTLIHHLAFIQQLCLKDVEWRKLSDSSVRLVLDGFTHVHSLTLSRVRFSSFNVFVWFICSFPALSTLTCESVWIDPRGLRTPLPGAQHLPALHTLRLGSGSKRFLFQWLLESGTQLQIHTLALQTIHPSDVQSVTNLVTFLGPALQHLSLELEAASAGTYLWC